MLKKISTAVCSLIIQSILILGGNYLDTAEIIIKSPEGNYFPLEIAPEDSFYGIIETLESLFSLPKEEQELLMIHDTYQEGQENAFQKFHLNFSDTDQYVNVYTALNGPRNYYAPMTQEEKDNIRYIVKTLSESTSVVSVLKHKKKLEKAGDRINGVHPLNFLSFVFTDEELKVGIRSLKEGGGYIWKNFFKGLKESLSEESHRNNMKDEFIQHFAQVVQVTPGDIIPSIKGTDWDGLISILIEKIPRKGNYKRYDI